MLSLNATSIKSPVDQQSVDIPKDYSHFSDVFCPKKASQLPPHRPWDCAIDLLPGESVPKGKIYPVTPRAKGHGGVYWRGSPTGLHLPFYLPCCFKFLFCGQEGRRLAALYRLPVNEHLRGATIFTKLDFRSAYNLIQKREGDKWKTAFVIPTGLVFLGSHIDSSGIRMDEGKVEAIKTSNVSWDTPTSTAASYRTTVPLPIHSRTYSATSPSLCPGP